MKHHAGQCRQVLPCLFGFFVCFQVIWGRKDGFPGADGSTITQATGTISNAKTIPIYGATGNAVQITFIAINSSISNSNHTLNYSVKNPLHFIYNSTAPFDWYTNNTLYQDNTLWGDHAGKSMNDPCPSGWRVPTDGSWEDFSADAFNYYMQSKQTTTGIFHLTNGRQYKNIAWYPAGGYRVYLTGELNVVGSNGYWWSSTSSDILAKNSSYNIQEITRTASYHRARGFSIRCIQE